MAPQIPYSDNLTKETAQIESKTTAETNNLSNVNS